MNKSLNYHKKGNSSLLTFLFILFVIALVVYLANKLGFKGDLRGRATGSDVVYYVDCNATNDNGLGTSEVTAWKSINKVNNAILMPGEKVLFKRGCVWTGTANGDFLMANWDGTADAPITLGAYGSGVLPIIRSDARGIAGSHINLSIGGDYIVVENIHSTLINPMREASCLQSDGTGVRLGWYVGFSVSGSHVTLNNVEASRLSLAVNLADNSSNNKLLNSNIHDLDALWRIDKNVNALGAMGVNLHGNDHEVAYTLFERNGAQCNYVDNGQDQNYSAPFEIYNANRSYVHHNKAYEHRKHYEMGKAPDKTSTGNVLAYNLFVSSKPSARGPNIHGSNNRFGPINNTQIYNNTMIFTGPTSEALICGCSGGATIKNNIFIAESKAAYYSGNFTEANNLYWDYEKTTDSQADPFVQFAPGSSSSSINSNSYLDEDPTFLNSVVPGGDYHLGTGSMAINSGVSIFNLLDGRLRDILARDLDNNSAPQGAQKEMGVFEISVAIPTPTSVPSPTQTPAPTSGATSFPTPAVSPPTGSDAVPSIRITGLSNGATVPRSSSTTINAEAADDNGVVKVDFFIDGNLVATDNTAPYSYDWKISGAPNRQYTLRVRATDTIGQVKNSSIAVTSNSN